MAVSQRFLFRSNPVPHGHNVFCINSFSVPSSLNSSRFNFCVLAERSTAGDESVQNVDSTTLNATSSKDSEVPLKNDLSFEDILAFDGPGPERINGRLAMTGFASALTLEAQIHESVWRQLTDPEGTGLFWLIFFTNILILASFIPLQKGKDPANISGLFSGDAEMVNGRVAMLGFVGLILLEKIVDSPLL